MLQYGMRSNLVQHAFQRCSSRLNKVGLETTQGLLLRWWRNDDTGAVVVQLVVQPKEVAVSAGDGEFGIAVTFRGGLGGDRVLCVRARQVAHLVRVAHVDGE